MKYSLVILFVLAIVGCQSAAPPHSHSSPSIALDQGQGSHGVVADEHDDHGAKKEGFLLLTPAQSRQLKVETVPVVAISGQTTGMRPGRIEADPDQKVVISSQVAGTLSQLNAQVGSRVRAGASIAVISSQQVTALQAEFHQAEVESELAQKELANKTELFEVGDDIRQPLETARLEVFKAKAQRDSVRARLSSAVLKNDRLETLLQEGIASRQQVEQSRADRKALEAELEQTEATLEISKLHLSRETQVTDSRLRVKAETFPAEARLARAAEQMRHSRERLEQLGASPHEHTGLVHLNSPITGTVVERPFSVGAMISPGESIAVIVDSSKVWVWVDLQRSDLEFIQVGDPIELSLINKPDETAQGYLDYISPELDRGTQTLTARVELADPPAGFQLGSFVNARVTNGSGEPVPSIPQGSVQFVEGNTVVYLRSGEGFQRTVVTLGASVGEGLVAVEGLRVGDQVAVTGVEQLKSLDLSENIGGHQH